MANKSLKKHILTHVSRFTESLKFCKSVGPISIVMILVHQELTSSVVTSVKVITNLKNTDGSIRD